MSDKQIVLIITDGVVKAEAQGYNGQGCDDATRFLEELGELTETKHKKEYRRGANAAQAERKTRA